MSKIVVSEVFVQQDPDILAKNLRTLWDKYETTDDGTPDGLGDTGEKLFSYVMDNFEDICSYLETWDSE